jgi:hypothetical protein
MKVQYVTANYGPNDLYGPVRNAFDAGKSITRASGGGGLGFGNQRDWYVRNTYLVVKTLQAVHYNAQ